MPGGGVPRSASAVAAAEALRKDALARRQLAELNARRYRDLGGRSFVSTSAVEGKQQELDSAAATLEASEANLQGARQELRRLQAERATAPKASAGRGRKAVVQS